MRRVLLLVSILTFTLLPSLVNSAVIVSPVETKIPTVENPKVVTPSVKDIERTLGRKLTLKEKIALFFLKKKLKKAHEGASSGETALMFGIFGVVFLIAGLFLPYIILGALAFGIVAVVLGNAAKKQNPRDTKASSAVLLGWITLGGIALLLILIAAILSSINWY